MKKIVVVAAIALAVSSITAGTASAEPTYRTAKEVCQAIAKQQPFAQHDPLVKVTDKDRATCSFFNRVTNDTEAVLNVLISPKLTGQKKRDWWEKNIEEAKHYRPYITKDLSDGRIVFLDLWLPVEDRMLAELSNQIGLRQGF